MGGRGFAAVGRRALLAVLACVLCLCCWRCLRARTRAFLLSYPVYYKRRGVWCPAAFATDGRRGLLALDVFRRPQFFFLRARGRCQRHRRPSHFHNHYLTVNPSGSAKVRAWFMRHNKPGGFCVYKTALSFSTGAGLAHPAAMRAPLFYLPRASGAQNLVCLRHTRYLRSSARPCGFSSSTCLELEIFGGPTFLTPIGFLLPSSFLFLSALPDIFIV